MHFYKYFYVLIILTPESDSNKFWSEAISELAAYILL